MSMVTEEGEPIVAAGEYRISVGGGQPGTGAPSAEGSFKIQGTITLPE
jgi:beta-glucosidase